MGLRSATGGRNGAPVVGETALKAFNLKTAAFKASYAFPNNGLCNDMAVAKDGTVYATDTTQGRVLRLKKGAKAPTCGQLIRCCLRRLTASRFSPTVISM